MHEGSSTVLIDTGDKLLAVRFQLDNFSEPVNLLCSGTVKYVTVM
eukprot:COSAG01_NODE_59613_length_299_cov_1.005000_2_plen_44_part_01